MAAGAWEGAKRHPRFPAHADSTAGVAAPGWTVPAMPRHWGSQGLRPGLNKDGEQLWDGGRADLSRAQGVRDFVPICAVPRLARLPGWPLEHRGRGRGVTLLGVGVQAKRGVEGYKNHIFIPSEGSGQIKVIVWEALGYFSWLGARGRSILELGVSDPAASPSPGTPGAQPGLHPAHWEQLAVPELWKS